MITAELTIFATYEGMEGTLSVNGELTALRKGYSIPTIMDDADGELTLLGYTRRGMMWRYYRKDDVFRVLVKAIEDCL